MRPTPAIPLFALIVSSLSLLSGCSAQSNTPKPTGSRADSGPTLQQALSPQGQRAAAIAALPQADTHVPPEQYLPISSGNQLMFLYYGLINLPVDYDKVAQAYSSEYRSTNDEFRKKDVVEALKPRIDAQIADSRQHRYFAVETPAGLGHYDFTAKGFPVNGSLGGNTYGYFMDNGAYKYSFTNGEAFKLLPVPDEALARRIEDMVHRGIPMSLRLYAFAQDVDPNQQIVKSQIVTLKLLDNHGIALVSE